MGEALICRRGSSGGSEIQVSVGSSVPNVPYGVHGYTTAEMKAARFTNFANPAGSFINPYSPCPVNPSTAVFDGSRFVYTFLTRSPNVGPRCYKLDITTGIWTEISSSFANAPSNYILAHAAWWNGYGYLLAAGSTNYMRIWRYDPNANTWTLHGNNVFSTPYYNWSYKEFPNVSTFYNGVWYFNNGEKITIDTQQREVWCTDPLLKNRDNYASIISDGAGSIYLVGGNWNTYNGSAHGTTDFYRYNIASGIKTQVGTLPTQACSASLAIIGATLLIYGGCSGSNSTDEDDNTYMYDRPLFLTANLNTGIVSTMATPTEGGWFKCVTVGNLALMLGRVYYKGTTSTLNTTLMKVYTAVGDPYPAGTVVVSTNFDGRKATICKNDKVNVDVFVNGVYYHNGSALQAIGFNTRYEGGNWV